MIRTTVLSLGSMLLIAASLRAQIDQFEAFPGFSGGLQTPTQSLGLAGQAGGFGGFGAAGAGAGGAGGLGGEPLLQLRLPSPVPVQLPLFLMPAKPILVLRPEDRAGDSVLTEVDAARRVVIARIKELRKKRDARGVVRAVRELEQLRQRRLQRVREIGTRVVREPEPDDTTAPSPTEESVPVIPILPVPAGPVKSGNG